MLCWCCVALFVVSYHVVTKHGDFTMEHVHVQCKTHATHIYMYMYVHVHVYIHVICFSYLSYIWLLKQYAGSASPERAKYSLNIPEI